MNNLPESIARSFPTTAHAQSILWASVEENELFPAPASYPAKQAQMLISTCNFSPHPPMSCASPWHLAPGWLLPLWGRQRGQSKGREGRTCKLGKCATFTGWSHILSCTVAVLESSAHLTCTFRRWGGWWFRVRRSMLLEQNANNWHISNDTARASLPSPLASACPLCFSGKHKRQSHARACSHFNADIYSRVHKKRELWGETLAPRRPGKDVASGHYGLTERSGQ